MVIKPQFTDRTIATNDSSFTKKQIAIIRKEWTQGTSVRAIGLMIGRSKSSVGGKIFRLGLPRRPSPIKRHEGCNQTAKSAKKQDKPGRQQTAQSSLYAPKIARKSYTGENPVRGGECLWCDGEPGAWVLCRKKISRRFFCEEHAAVGFNSVGTKIKKD